MSDKEQKKQNNEISDEQVMEELKEDLAQQVRKEIGTLDKEPENNNSVPPKKRIPKWAKITGIAAAVLLTVISVFAITVYAVLGQVNVTDWSDTKQQEEIFETDNEEGEEIDPNSIMWNNQVIKRSEKQVINILLVGEEAIGAGSARGRTDSIMIATINAKQKALKLTSLMRDIYVQIPGYSDNKLNAAYHNGGMPLLKDTIEKNFGLKVDGSVLVNFDGFETIIDKLGGVDITLTSEEAYYMNTTNYVSKPKNRNVKEGFQTLNGNQALGYTRIRYRKAANGEADDFGRTARQRNVLNAVFEKYKSKNAAELALLLTDILPLVTTDLTENEILSYIVTVATMGPGELETIRIPVNNCYIGAKVRGMSVLLPDMQKNIEALHMFIFGSTDIQEVGNDLLAPSYSAGKAVSSGSVRTADFK